MAGVGCAATAPAVVEPAEYLPGDIQLVAHRQIDPEPTKVKEGDCVTYTGTLSGNDPHASATLDLCRYGDALTGTLTWKSLHSGDKPAARRGHRRWKRDSPEGCALARGIAESVVAFLHDRRLPTDHSEERCAARELLVIRVQRPGEGRSRAHLRHGLLTHASLNCSAGARNARRPRVSASYARATAPRALVTRADLGSQRVMRVMLVRGRS